MHVIHQLSVNTDTQKNIIDLNGLLLIDLKVVLAQELVLKEFQVILDFLREYYFCCFCTIGDISETGKIGINSILN